jgi:hypothetical protein
VDFIYLFQIVCKNYITLTCLNGFFAIFNFNNILIKSSIFILVLVSACKQLQENKSVAGILKTKEKNPPKQESLVFLERTVHRVGETAENQRKTREKSKAAENQVFWLDFCAKKKNCAYPLWFPDSEILLCILITEKVQTFFVIY